MRNLGKFVWLLPVAVHLGYLAATTPSLPDKIGATVDSPGTPWTLFLAGWIGTIALANTAFAAILFKLPHMSDRMLALPGHRRWLATRERKSELTDRLQTICETALTCMNVFFLAVYQAIYQANVPAAIVSFDTTVLFVAFMVLPLLLIVIVTIMVLRGLKI